MISSASPNDLADIVAFCENDYLGTQILTKLMVYGFDSLMVSCAVSRFDGRLNTVILQEGRLMTVLADAAADYDELYSYLNMTLPLRVYAYCDVACKLDLFGCERAVIARYDGGSFGNDALCSEVTSENIALLYPCIFPFLDPKFTDRDPWLTENSHKLRHGLSFGKAVIIDGKAVSCALAESVTDKVAVIGSVSTLNEYRQRGFASACIRSLVSDLQTSGRDILLAFTNKSLSGFYSGLGFDPVDDFYIYHGKKYVDRNH